MTEIYAVLYRYSADTALRAEHRPEHRIFLNDLLDSRKLVVCGPFTDSAGALLMVRAESSTGAAEMLDNDPFMRFGCIVDRTIHQFKPSIGHIG